MFKHMLNNSAFSLTETIMALAIFSIVALGALKSLHNSLKTKKDAIVYFKIYQYLNNLVSQIKYNKSKYFNIKSKKGVFNDKNYTWKIEILKPDLNLVSDIKKFNNKFKIATTSIVLKGVKQLQAILTEMVKKVKVTVFYKKTYKRSIYFYIVNEAIKNL